MIYTTGTIAISGNAVTGTGTNFSAPLSLIRVGCTLIAIGNPVQIFTITEIKSGTELSVTPAANPAIPAGTKFSILLSDSISVDGLAQDVAETLRYYQGQETEIAAAVEWWKDFGGDGQMDQLLANIREETAKSTANAQKTEADKNTTEGYKNAAASSATAAKSSQDAAKASETSASNSKTAAATSETNAAKSAADALNYRNQAQGIVGNNIGLGASPRDCPDISGNPSGYIGFMRIKEKATGFPSIASGEAYLTGFISVCDGSPTYTGIFQGWNTRSLYTYRWSSGIGPQWTRHARKDDISRLVQGSQESALWAAGGKQKFVLWDSGTGDTIEWGVYDNSAGQWKPLGVAQGGTGGRNAGQARTNLQVFHESWDNLGQKDLDTLTGEYSGIYFNGMSADCTPERHYPEKTAGALKVIRNRANGNSGCSQYYYPFNTNDRYYSRWFNAADMVWTAWNEWRRPNDNDDFRNLIGLGRNNARDFLNLALRSTYSQPFSIASANPTIRFDETDRPSGAPLYEFVFDGGNWRIQKGGAGYNGEHVISYEYANDRIVIPNLKVDDLYASANKVQQIKNNLLIPNTGLSRWYDYAAPAGAEANKYYPIIISHPSGWNGDTLAEVSMRTRSLSGNQEPNCNAIHLWMRDAGWSDMGAAAFGHYFCYARDENAILCVRGTDKGQYPHNAIYVRGDAFPIRLAATVGCSVTIPTADWKPSTASDSPTYKWGITNSSDGIDLDTYGISNNLLDFTSSATGFYCTDTYRNKYGNPYLVVQQNGAIQPANGVEIYSNIDWNTQQSDNVSKFKPIAGNANTPESDLTYGGFHVGFNGTHATQFAGRNSKFFARSFEAGVDKGWCQLATLNASSQRWTGYQQFKSTEFFADTYTRKVSLAVANSAVRNGELYLWGAESRPTVFEYKIKDPDTNASLNWVFYAQQNTDDSCQFQVNGAVNCVTVNQSSDRDLKDNIQVISNATEAIRKMNGYTYTLKENGLPYAGIIAQEAMEAIPEAVGSFTHYGEALQGPTIDGNELREETRYLNVDYAAVTGLLVQVARETDNRVTELEEENASLRANIAVMDERITKLEALVRQLTGSEE